MQTLNQVLSSTELDEFVERGFVLLRNAFDPEAAATVRQLIWKQMGLSPDDPAGWTKPIVHLMFTLWGPEVDVCFTPRLLGAFDQLMGDGRWIKNDEQGLGWWPVSFPGFFAPPWVKPVQGWHVDGSHFHHHLNGPQQGLLPIFIFSDIPVGGGGTCVRVGSHHATARVLRDAEPEGLEANELARRVNLVADGEVVEVSGNAGDVALIHPFLAHARSENTGPNVRFICNPCFGLHEPMNFEREDGVYSPVELAIKQALDL